MTFVDDIMKEVPSDEEIAEQLAPYGDTDRGLRKSKPDASGLVQYLWRMCRFHSGADTHMPVTAYWWLQDWLDSNGFDASVSGIHDDAGKQVMDELSVTVRNVLRDHFGKSDLKAAQRWHEAGLM
jgi:hypothetical protein